jgi:acyl-coenzyme A thioesterase 13
VESVNARIDYFKQFIGRSFDESPSGVARWLGGILKTVEEGKLEIEYTVREDMTNPMHTLHGGTAAMIMDEVIGSMVYLLGDAYAHTSVNLNCDFLNSAGIGTRLLASAVVVRKGRNIVHCECTIRNEQEKIIAKSSSNLIVTPVLLNL